MPTCKEELESAVNDLTSDKVQLQTTMDLLDGALRTLEDLKPQCVDSTMSYEERKAGTFSWRESKQKLKDFVEMDTN